MQNIESFSIEILPDNCVQWPEKSALHQARWQSVHGWTAPKQALIGEDTLSADLAFRLINEGIGIIWRGDFQNGKQLLAALKRRIAKKKLPSESIAYPNRFHLIRQARSQNARALGRLLIPLEPEYQLAHRRSPSIATACEMALSPIPVPSQLMPLTELVGIMSAYEWQRQGLVVNALGPPPGQRIYPRYGVFAPTRHEYLDLIAKAPLPAQCQNALDVGTGTGVIAVILAQRGVKHVVATDTEAPALRCSQDNVDSLGLGNQIDIQKADVFAPGRFDLVVCNPPWLPGAAKNALDAAIYDPDSRLLTQFLTGVGQHLNPGGQAWLILSDLAEHLRLRDRQTLLALIHKGGLKVLTRRDIKPDHAKLKKDTDPLFGVRQHEITSLWQLTLA